MNNPHVGKSGVYASDGSWSGWFGAAASSAAPPEPAPPLVSKTVFPEVSRASFDPYLSSISEPFSRFEDIRHHERQSADLGRSSSDLARSVSDLGLAGAGPGEALVACLREVPSLYFKEDFALEEGVTFRAACPFASAAENSVLQEKLSHYLDVVELHLVREIALRSDSFFEAQGQLQDLNGRILKACGRIQGLKEKIRLLEGDLVGSARQIQDSNATRKNLLALEQKLKLMLYVSQAQTTLKLVSSFFFLLCSCGNIIIEHAENAKTLMHHDDLRTCDFPLSI